MNKLGQLLDVLQPQFDEVTVNTTWTLSQAIGTGDPWLVEVTLNSDGIRTVALIQQLNPAKGVPRAMRLRFPERYKITAGVELHFVHHPVHGTFLSRFTNPAVGVSTAFDQTGTKADYEATEFAQSWLQNLINMDYAVEAWQSRPDLTHGNPMAAAIGTKGSLTKMNLNPQIAEFQSVMTDRNFPKQLPSPTKDQVLAFTAMLNHFGIKHQVPAEQMVWLLSWALVSGTQQAFQHPTVTPWLQSVLMAMEDYTVRQGVLRGTHGESMDGTRPGLILPC